MRFGVRKSPRVVAKTIFPVRDMAMSAAFYETAGFEVDGFGTDYAIVLHNGEELLHLRQVVSLDHTGNESAVYLHVQSADDWHARWRDAKLDVSPLVDERHGMREFRLRDPNGNLIRVGHNL